MIMKKSHDSEDNDNDDESDMVMKRIIILRAKMMMRVI
jgi:hypothetical protein